VSDHVEERPDGRDPEPSARPDDPAAKAAADMAELLLDSVKENVARREEHDQAERESILDLAAQYHDAGVDPSEILTALEEAGGVELAASFALNVADDYEGDSPPDWVSAFAGQKAHEQQVWAEVEAQEKAAELRAAAVAAIERATKAVPGADLDSALDLLEQAGAPATGDPADIQKAVEHGLRGVREIERARAEAIADAEQLWDFRPLEGSGDFITGEQLEAQKQAFIQEHAETRLQAHLDASRLSAPPTPEEAQQNAENELLSDKRVMDEEFGALGGVKAGKSVRQMNEEARRYDRGEALSDVEARIAHLAAFASKATPHPVLVPREVAGQPARLPPIPQEPSKKACSWRKSRPTLAQPASQRSRFVSRRSRRSCLFRRKPTRMRDTGASSHECSVAPDAAVGLQGVSARRATAATRRNSAAAAAAPRSPVARPCRAGTAAARRATVAPANASSEATSRRPTRTAVTAGRSTAASGAGPRDKETSSKKMRTAAARTGMLQTGTSSP
jgi:hypothetical protein